MRNLEVIERQNSLLKTALGNLLPAGSSYALLDFPDHSNVGDSAIWLGEIRVLQAVTKNPPAYVCTIESFDAQELKIALPVGPILLHGGGNFGDLWPAHQLFRERVMHLFPDRLVIQLPQSIKFNDTGAVRRCAEAVESHAHFHLFVRDAQSLEFAKAQLGCQTTLVPDAAFALGPLQRTARPGGRLFLLLRTDSEQGTYDRSGFGKLDAVCADWLDEPAGFRRASKRIAAVKSLCRMKLGRQQMRQIYYDQLASGRLKRGLDLLSSGQNVITDRLHAHILSTLLDITHVALDNSYGKISGYIDAWTREYAGVDTALSAAEAVQKLDRLTHS